MPSSFRTGECETNIEQEHSPLSRNCADKSFVFEGAVSCVFWRWPAGQLWILLGKGGVAAPSKRCCEATKSGADGVVRSREIVLEFERTTPFLMFRPTGLTLRAAPFKGTGIFLDGASTPPLPRRHLRLIVNTRIHKFSTVFPQLSALGL